MRIQVIGVCRFSVLTIGGFKTGPQSLEERAAFLFDEARLASRMAWFQHVVLPSIRAQGDRDFIFVVQASSLLPQIWRDRLSQAVEGIAEIQLEFLEPGPHFQLANGGFHRRIAPDAEVVAQFRLDDDDAIARDYVHRVRKDFREYLWPLFRRHRAVCGDYASGFVLEADGDVARLFQCYVTTWTPGQTVYLPPDVKNGLFSWGHHRLHSVMPTVTMSDSNMFLRGRHGRNDSTFRVPGQDTRDWGLGALERRFGIRIEDLQTALRDAHQEGLAEG